MKQIYGWITSPEMDLEYALFELRNRVTALETELADLRADRRLRLVDPDVVQHDED
jgi:hypothetical protein